MTRRNMSIAFCLFLMLIPLLMTGFVFINYIDEIEGEPRFPQTQNVADQKRRMVYIQDNLEAAVAEMRESHKGDTLKGDAFQEFDDDVVVMKALEDELNEKNRPRLLELVVI